MDTAKRTERMADAHHAFAAVGEGAILQRRACKLGFLCRSESGGLKRISLAQEQERTPGYAIGDPSVTGSRPPSPSLGATQCHGHTFPRFSVESPTESRMHPLQKSACPPPASRESAGPCLHAASCSSRSPTSVCRREAASLQAPLAVQHVSEPCALSLLQPFVEASSRGITVSRAKARPLIGYRVSWWEKSKFRDLGLNVRVLMYGIIYNRLGFLGFLEGSRAHGTGLA
jgi:hypothetical protein